MLRMLSIRAKVLTLVALGLITAAVLGAFGYGTVNEVKVNGPIYERIVQMRDLVADILPPPEYIIESHLLVHQMLQEQDPEAVRMLIQRGDELRQAYEDRRTYWTGSLGPGLIRETLLEDSYRPARAFFAARDADFVPALLRGDRATAAKLLDGPLKANYEAHRAAIDRLVTLANTRTTQEESTARTTVQARTVRLIASCSLLMLVLCFAGAWIGRDVVKPIERTAAVLEAVAGGDLNARLPEDRKDEAGRMAVAFNRAVEELKLMREADVARSQEERRQRAELQAKVDHVLAAVRRIGSGDLTTAIAVAGQDAIGQIGEGLRRLVEDLNTNMLEITSMAEAMACASEQMGTTSRQLAGAAEQTSGQAVSVSAAAVEVSANVETVALSAREMSASIQDIARSAQASSRVTSSATHIAEAASDVIAKLGASSADIGKVIKVITSIAEQTNLLALNATIEAARAGEAGKGFAVVANEVKELAKETARATQEIGQKIAAIQSDSGAAVSAVKQIQAVIVEVESITTSIAGAVEEQTATASEIGRNVAEASKGTEGIAQAITGVAHGSKSTASGSGDILGAASALAELAAQLQHLVSRFKLAGRPSEQRPHTAWASV